MDCAFSLIFLFFVVFFVLFCPPVRPATMTGLLLHCAVLLLSVSTFAAGVDFQSGYKPSGQSVFVKRSDTGEGKAAKNIRRSLPAWLAPSSPSSSHHNIKRRSTTDQSDSSCRALQEYGTKLADNTHRVSYLPRGPVTLCTSHG